MLPHAGTLTSGATGRPPSHTSFILWKWPALSPRRRAATTRTWSVAALLHDAVEDQEVSPALIAERWGDDVARLVMEVPDDKTLDKALRK